MACIYRSPKTGKTCGASREAVIHGRFAVTSYYASIPPHPYEGGVDAAALPAEVPAGC